MAFCPNCGRQIEDPTVGCPNCNSVQTTEEPKIKTSKSKNNKPAKKKSVVVFGGLLAIIVVILLIVSLSGGKPYKKAIDTYLDFTYKGNIENYENLVPPSYWDYIEESYDMKVEEIIEENEEILEELKEEIEDDWGEKVKVSYKIIESEKLEKSDLKDIKDYLKDRYDIPKKTITEAHDVEIEISVKGSEDEDEDEIEFFAIKIDGKWYLLNEYYSFMIPEIF